MKPTYEELEKELQNLRGINRRYYYFLNNIKKDIAFQYGEDSLIYKNIVDFENRREKIKNRVT